MALGKRSGGRSSDRARRSPGACCAAARRMGQLRGPAWRGALGKQLRLLPAAGRVPRAAVPGTGTLLKGTCPQGQWGVYGVLCGRRNRAGTWGGLNGCL